MSELQSATVGRVIHAATASQSMIERPGFSGLSPERQADLRTRHAQNQDSLALTREGIWVADGVSTSGGGEIASSLVVAEFSGFMAAHQSLNEPPEMVREMAHEAAAHADRALGRMKAGGGEGSTTLAALIGTNDPHQWVRWTTGDSRSIHGRGGRLLSMGVVQTVTRPDAAGQTKSYVSNTFRGTGRPSPDTIPKPYRHLPAGLFLDVSEIIELCYGDTVILYTDGLDGGTAAQLQAGEQLDPGLILHEADRHLTTTRAAQALLTLPDRIERQVQHATPEQRFWAQVDDTTVAVGRVMLQKT